MLGGPSSNDPRIDCECGYLFRGAQVGILIASSIGVSVSCLMEPTAKSLPDGEIGASAAYAAVGYRPVAANKHDNR